MFRIYIILLSIIIALFARHFNLKLRRLKRNIPILLNDYSVYYRNLTPKEQKHFERRVLTFISLKHFYRFDQSKATDEMKILIAAAAVQLTFGFSEGCEYEVFRKIAISDKEYVSRQTKRVHHGEANPGKSLIAFSWQRFMEGVKYPHDSINLGLHEFAHALFINNISGYCNRHFCKTIGEWHAVVAQLTQEQKIYNFFRSYAFEDRMEFFAVSIEYFFETPKAFHTSLPQLYTVICRLLNQNPMLPNNGIVRKSRLNVLKNEY